MTHPLVSNIEQLRELLKKSSDDLPTLSSLKALEDQADALLREQPSLIARAGSAIIAACRQARQAVDSGDPVRIRDANMVIDAVLSIMGRIVREHFAYDPDVPPSTTATRGNRDPESLYYERPGRRIECESPEAASHWDDRNWKQ